MKLTVNEVEYDFEVDEDTPLLWVLRDTLGMTGTKFACGVAQCGACSVMVDGELQRSCVLPISAVEGRSVSTIEGLSTDNSHPVSRLGLLKMFPSAVTVSPDKLWRLLPCLNALRTRAMKRSTRQ